MCAFQFRSDTDHFVFAKPQYDVIENFSFLEQVHLRHPNLAAGSELPLPPPPPLPSPATEPPPGTIQKRRVPVVGYIMKPDVKHEDPVTTAPSVTVGRRLKPEVYRLTEVMTTTAEVTTTLAESSCSPAAAAEVVSQTPMLPAVLTSAAAAAAASIATCQTIAVRTATPPLTEPSSLSSPPPEMMLHEYCHSLEQNYHTSVTNTLVQHLQGLNDDPLYKPNIILLTGAAGSGKTFCAQRACQLGGYDLLQTDSIDDDPHERARLILTSRPDVFGPHRDKRICMALFEAVDGMKPEQRTAITRIIDAVAGNGPTKEKRRVAVRFRTNLVVLVANDRYDPEVRDLVYKLNPVELKVNDLSFDQRAMLVENCCTYAGRTMSSRLYRLISSTPSNMIALLSKISLLFLSSLDETNATEEETAKPDDEVAFNEHTKVDERTMNIFAACRTLLKPPDVMNSLTSQYETLSFDQYEKTWELGGPKVMNTLFNSYQNFVHFVPETPPAVKAWVQTPGPNTRASAQASMRDMCRAGDYFYRGVQSMAEVADGFSLLDQSNHAADEVFDQWFKRRFKHEMQEVVSRNSAEPKIDLAAQPRFVSTPACLARCHVQRGDHETLHFAATMNQIEMQRHVKDFTYQPSKAYDLAKHIGFYETVSELHEDQRLRVDMFAHSAKKSHKRGEEEDKASATTDTKASGRKRPHISPRMECVEIFGHFAPVTPPVTHVHTSARKGGANFTIRLSNGESAQPKSRGGGSTPTPTPKVTAAAAKLRRPQHMRKSDMA